MIEHLGAPGVKPERFNLRRPKRYNRTLLRALYLAAQSAVIRPGPSRDYYLRKRSEGCNHKQAISP